MRRKPSIHAPICPIQAQQLRFPAYIQMDAHMSPRIFIIIPASTLPFASFADLEKSSSFLSKVNISKVHVKLHLRLQSHLSSNLQSPRTQKAAQLPRMVPSSVGQKPVEKTHSFISTERDVNTGLRSPQRVVGKRNASSLFQGNNFRPLKIRFKPFPDYTPAQFLHNSSQA